MSGRIRRFRFNILVLRHSDIEVDQAANVAGWMTYEELKWLAKEAKKYHTIVEIGSYQGRSTRVLGDNTSGVVYAIDDFIGPRDKQIIGLPIFEIFCGNQYDLIQSGKVIPVVADHSNIELNVRPDMVFIDGSHLYQDVKRDIEFWKSQILSGGLLCGHDAQFEQIKQAVGESFKKYSVAPNTSIWYVTCD